MNESHPERNTDVILFVDSFAEARLGGEGTLDLAVRATAALADAYVRRRDRVGLIGYGGILRWLAPGTGTVQLYRIVDALLDTEIVLSYYWKEIDVIPRRVLPPNALVIALSPLLDPRSVGALLDLRARGFDLAVIDVSPIPYAPRPERRPRRARVRHLDAAARRAASPPAAARASRSPSGAPTRPCRHTWRRCGNFADTAGSCAPDHRGRQPRRVRRGGGRRATRGRPPRRAWRPAVEGAALACCAGRARAALARRSIPWAVLAAGGGYLIGREGHAVVDGRAAVVGVLLLLGAELATWSIEHDGRIRAERAVVVRRAVTLAGLAVAALVGRPGPARRGLAARAAAASWSPRPASARRSPRSAFVVRLVRTS